MHDIRKFISGFANFRDTYFCCDDSPFNVLRQGQHPRTMVVACSDSRTDPSLIMQCGPGEIFVIRNVANIVPPFETDSGFHGVSSAIEYAVKSLKVSNIIVLGHSGCGGIDALMHRSTEDTDFIDKWLSVMGGVRDEVLAHFGWADKHSCTACEMAGIIASLENLMTFPWIASRVKDGDLDLHGWYFDMETGQLLSYLSQTKSFEPLTYSCTPEEYDSPAADEDEA
ncbi:carbonic anhydrase [Desulfocurvus sp. DL9XJH121]